MKEKDFIPESDKDQRLPQYGKKGHKPRNKFQRGTVNVDNITTNDIRYWNKAQGFENVTKFAWNFVQGYPRYIEDSVDLHDVPDNTYATLYDGIMNPFCIMGIDVVMGPGWAESTNDGVNRGLAQTMAQIRANLSTSNIGFETADLGIYLASTSSIAYMIGYAKRVLECRSVWKDRNMAYPKALIKAMGCDYYDIFKNYNSYASQLNSAIDRYNHMRIPDFSDCYDRQYAMMHNIFCDEDSDYGQLYIFKPRNYYVYDDTSTPSKAKFKVFSFPDNDKSGFENILDHINEALDAWYGSSDMYQINGTLLRAFKEAPVQEMPYLKEEDQIDPVQDRAHLMQIMNCNIIPFPSTESLDITQEPNYQNYVIWTPEAETSGESGPNKQSAILRLFEDDVSSEDNMELTRLLNLYTSEYGGGDKWVTKFRNCGSELVTDIVLYRYSAPDDYVYDVSLERNYIVINSSSNIEGDKLAAISPFRYIPAIYILQNVNDHGDNTLYYKGLVGDLYNWMIYNIDDWKQLQFNAYWSLWKPNI